MKTGKIYKIISTQGNEIYVGSTFNTTRDRFKQHKSDYKRWKEGNCPNISVFKLFEKYGIDNCKMVLIKQYDIIDRKHLEVYETLWILKLRLNCVNKLQPFCIKKLKNSLYYQKNKKQIQKYKQQYYQENKEQLQQRSQQYYQNNKEKIQNKYQNYHQNNKEKINQNKKQYYQQNKEKLKQKFNCDCGGKYGYTTKSIHIKTQKHQKWLERQNQN